MASRMKYEKLNRDDRVRQRGGDSIHKDKRGAWSPFSLDEWKPKDATLASAMEYVDTYHGSNRFIGRMKAERQKSQARDGYWIPSERQATVILEIKASEG